MPELPEVEAVCRELRRQVLGAEIARSRVFRRSGVRPATPALLARRTRGRTITAVDRRGKNIFLHLSGGTVLRVHLRMTGDLRVVGDARLRPAATRVSFELNDGRSLIFEDPRALGVLDVLSLPEAATMMAALGPEPLGEEFTAGSFVMSAQRSRKPAKLFLMDQSHVAGLGNIYAAEALFRARVHPARPMNRVFRSKLVALHAAIVEVLREAVEAVCEGADDFPRQVYGREDQPCFRCGARIRRMPQGGRSTYFCPHCQKGSA